MMADLKGFATNLFGGIIDKNPTVFDFVKNNLPRAGIRIAYRTYMSVTIFIALLTYVGTVIALVIALSIVSISFLMKLMYILFAPVLTALTAFLIFSFYPYQVASTRRKNIESSLPFVLTHMGAIAESGVPPYVIFKLISEFKEYGEISKEMEKIVRNIETFGINPLSAVKETAEKTPSESFKQLLLGFITTTESGGNIKVFLKAAGDQALFEWRMKREKFLQQLSAYAEFYTGILIAAPLFIIALFAVMNMVSPTLSGYNILDLMKLSIYILLPVLNATFLVFLKGVEVEI
jgi:flagellar protein FlaJ